MQKITQTLIKWLPTGAGAGVTVHFLLSHQWIQAVISTFITACSSVWVKFSGKFMETLEQEAEKKGESSAKYLIQTVNSLPVKLGFRDKYYQSLIYTYRDFLTRGLKTKGPFTLDLEKVFVPLRVSPESPEKTSSEIIRSSESSSGYSIWDFLVATPTHPNFQSMVIIGAPGSGKTTLLEHLTLTYAKNIQHRQRRHTSKLIPILLYLRDVREAIAKEQPSLAALIEQQKSIRKLNPPSNWFENKLRHQECLVMLDGLDEVADNNQRISISRWVSQQIRDYPKARFLLTSRPFGYKSAPVENVKTVLEVQPFNLEQMQQFIHNWYLQKEIMSRLGKDDPGVREAATNQAEDLIQRIKKSPPLAAMALNPLLLTMIATVHSYRGALPGRRVELYAEICDVLLGRRQEAKGIQETLTADQKKAVLQVLALGLMENNTREFTLQLGSTLIQEELAKVAGSNTEPQVFLKNMELICGLLVEREKGQYEFAHKSFQEYLAAVQIKESSQENLLISNINNPWWDETIRLYAATSDATNLIRAALDNPTIVSLKLALDCQEEGLRVQPEVRKQLRDKLEAGLESDNPEIFKLAVEVKLARRLSNLLRIDENLEIDTSYITCAEYQLYVSQQLNSNEYRFQLGDAKKPITGISYGNALGFCSWLSSWDFSRNKNTAGTHNTNLYYFRLNNSSEAEKYPAKNNSELKFWTQEDGSRSAEEKGIRICRVQVTKQYNTLANYLVKGEWKKADQETTKVMLQVAGVKNRDILKKEDIKKIPCRKLRVIDELWVIYSYGRFGFSVQKHIYQELKNKENFSKCIGWIINDDWLGYDDLTFGLEAPVGHLPFRFYDSDKFAKRHWEVLEMYLAIFDILMECNI